MRREEWLTAEISFRAVHLDSRVSLTLSEAARRLDL